MRRLMTRRVMTWVAVPLMAGQIGCAARPARVATAEPRSAVTEADRKACEAYVGKQKTKSVVGLSILGIVAIPVSIGLAGASVATMNLQGLGVLGAGPGILGEVSKNAAENRATREAALRECLEPIEVERVEGPEHPKLAQSLARLGSGYLAVNDVAHAEPLYRRALAIQENALGPGHSDTVATRSLYVTLLRKAHRDAEATALDAMNPPPTAPADPSREAGPPADAPPSPTPSGPEAGAVSTEADRPALLAHSPE